MQAKMTLARPQTLPQRAAQKVQVTEANNSERLIKVQLNHCFLSVHLLVDIALGIF